MTAHAATIGVLGGGAWGTALAQALASDGTAVRLWAREPDVVEAVNTQRRNPLFLPSAELARSIKATNQIGDMAALPVLLAVVPAQHLGRVLAGLGQPPQDLVLCAKGIEAGTGRLMADVAQAALPGAEIAVLSGPTFAHEVAAGLPTAVTLACAGGEAQWQRLAPALSRPTLRPYYSDDVIGAEIGGAVKNVLAIACGVVDGLRLGQNAGAALIARGYAEMTRFGLSRGARAETLAGLCGLGDLVLTCSSTSSRNFALGKALGEGQSAEQALAGKSSVAEGAATAPVLADLAARAGLDLPIVNAVCRLLTGEAPARQVVAELLSRPLRAEGESA